MRVLRAGALYFAVTFAAGFVLGVIRVTWAVPKLGTRAAELMEAPIMLGVSVVAARWVARRLALPPAPAARLGVGLLALGFLLIAELMTALWVRGLGLDEYLAQRDPVAGSVYLAMLGAFAIMPVVVARR